MYTLRFVPMMNCGGNSGLTNARSLRVDDRSYVYVSTRLLDRVYAVSDKNGAKEVKIIATGLNSPNGIALPRSTVLGPARST